MHDWHTTQPAAQGEGLGAVAAVEEATAKYYPLNASSSAEGVVVVRGGSAAGGAAPPLTDWLHKAIFAN